MLSALSGCRSLSGAVRGLLSGCQTRAQLAKRLRASGGLSGGQLKGLCDAPEVGVPSYGTKAEIARRIGAKLATDRLHSSRP